MMHSHAEDEEHDFDLDDESFDDFGDTDTGEKKGIPKIAIIIGVILLVVFVIFLFGGGSEQAIDNSVVRGGSDVKQDVGTQELDPAMLEATQTLNDDNRVTAEDTGTSFIPIPTVAAQDSFAEIIEEEDEEDPLETWKSMQSERMRQEQFEREIREKQISIKKESVATQSRQDVVTQLATAMSASLSGIIEGKVIRPLSHNLVTDEEAYFNKIEEEKKQAMEEALSYAQLTTEVDTMTETTVPSLVLQATTIEYGQTLLEANSDVPGPVLVELVTGPLKGSRLLGSFTKEDDYLVIRFSTAVKDGKSYSIDAIVLDPDTTLPAMATEVDRRWLKRIVLPAAASFISGLGSAMAETSNTSVSVTGETVSETSTDLDTDEEFGKAIEEAAEKISEIIDEEAGATEILVKVHAGTPVGVLFLSPVYEDITQEPTASGAHNINPAAGSSISTSAGIPQSLQNIPGFSSLPMETIQQAVSNAQ